MKPATFTWKDIRFKVLAALLITFFILSIILISETFKNFDYSIGVVNGNNSRPAVYLTEGTSLSQTIDLSGYKAVKSIDVMFATYGRVNESNIRIITSDSASKTVIFQEDLAASSISDNSWYNIKIDKNNKSLNSSVRLERINVEIVGIDGDESNSLTVWLSDKTADSESLKVNDRETPNSVLRYRINYPVAVNVVMNIRFVVWLLLILTCLASIFLLSDSPEKNFLVISLTLGSLMIVFNTFYHPLDEITHFLRTFALTDLQINANTELGEPGYYLPVNVFSIIGNKLNLYDYTQSTLTGIEYFSNEKSLFMNPVKYAASASPLVYVPAAIGVGIARVIGLKAVYIILAGRLFNLLIYIAIAWFAIKETPVGKNLFMIIALLPTSIYLAASYSTDPVIISFSLLFVAGCLKYIYANNLDLSVSRMDILTLIIAAIFILHGKSMIYIFILFLFFFIPRSMFSGRQWQWTIVVAVIAFALVLLETRYFSQFTVVDDRTVGVSIKKQMLFIMQQPMSYLKILYKDKIIQQLVTNISDFSIDSFSSTIKSAIPIVLFGVAFTESDIRENIIGRRQKYFNLYCIATFSIIYILINTALYLTFNRVGSTVIEGVQMRYFLPILLLFYLPFNSFKLKTESQHYSAKIALFTIIFLINAYFPLILRL